MAIETVLVALEATWGGFLHLVLRFFAGWWFLLSPRYRECVLGRWREKGQMAAATDVTGSLVLMAAFLGLVVWAAIRIF